MHAGGEIRLGELVGALTYALDLAEGQTAGHALRACLIGMTLAERLGLDAEQRSELYYAHLLKDAGCSTNSSRVAALLAADDQAVKRELKLTDWTRLPDRARYASRVAARDRSAPARLARVALLARRQGEQREFTRLRCERGADIAAGLGFPRGTVDAIRALDEHWDGSGHPQGIRGDAIPLAARIMCLAQTADVFRTVRGVEVALAVARERRGRWFDPALVVAGAQQLGLPAGPEIVHAALLHDIGKLALSSRILDKPGPLNASEWAAVRAHPLHTEHLLGRVGPLRGVAAIAAAHHERLDGSGYPHGLAGDALSLPARLLAVADVFEAVTAARPYRAPVSPAAAVDLLRAEARAGRLDTDCVEAMAAL